jgi:3-keto-disaccharide hydrolase
MSLACPHQFLRFVVQSRSRNANGMRLFLLLITVLPISAALPETIRFDQAVSGKLPAGWTIAMTHAGPPPHWAIVRDESAPSQPNVLAQLSRDTTAGRFPLAIWDRALLQDGEVSVAFKTVDGSVDQAAGIVWRFQNANDYYVVRANALENNVVFYKVENGVRSSIAPKGLPSRSYGVKHTIPCGRWNKLKVSFARAKIAVFFNQERLFEAEDQTFSKPGKVGLWTKADSVTYFDDFTVVSKDASR